MYKGPGWDMTMSGSDPPKVDLSLEMAIEEPPPPPLVGDRKKPDQEGSDSDSASSGGFQQWRNHKVDHV